MRLAVPQLKLQARQLKQSLLRLLPRVKPPAQLLVSRQPMPPRPQRQQHHKLAPSFKESLHQPLQRKLGSRLKFRLLRQHKPPVLPLA